MDNTQWGYDSIENWYQVVGGNADCDLCGKKGVGVYYISDEESACLSCILELFRQVAIDIIEETEDGLEILDAFDPELPPPLKIGMFLSMDELLEVLKKLPEEKRIIIYHSIIFSMGYNSPHPLSPLLRSIAVNKIILADDALLGTVLKDIDRDLSSYPAIDSKIFNYNMALTLSYLAPYNKLTRSLIEKILIKAKKRRDSFVLNWFVLRDGYYFPREDYFSEKGASFQLIKTYRIKKKVSVAAAAASSSGYTNSYRVKQALDEIYTLKYLKNIYNYYLSNVHKKAGISPQFVWPGDKAKKKDYIRIFAEILNNDSLVKVFLEELPEWLRISFEEMLWDDKFLTLNEFRKRGKLEIPKTKKYDYYYDPKLPHQAQLFQIWVYRGDYSSDREFFLYLDSLQKELFRSCFPVPENGKLVFNDENNSEYFVSTNSEILTQLQILVVYLGQVGLKRAKNGIKILKASIKEIKTVCNVPELYPEVKNLENLRLIMLLELVDKFIKKKKVNTQLSIDKLIKEIFSFYFDPKASSLFNFSQFLNYLKVSYIGNSPADQDRFYQERMAFQELLGQLVVDKWVGIENIYRYFNSKGTMPQPVKLSMYMDDVYFSISINRSYAAGVKRVNINDVNKGEALFRPYLKLVMFVLNTLGVVDIAYTEPKNNIFQDKKNPWLSVYDGIKEVSLTTLGAWILGKVDTYEGFTKKDSVEVVLDDKRLIVTVIGNDPVVDLTLTRMSRPLGAGCFIVSPDIFLHDCESAKDIRDKINIFKTNICKNPPQIWEEFFNSLLQKANPLEYKQEEMLLFKLDPANKDLISLLFSDPHLKYNIMKVEDYHILIKEGSYKAVKTRLAEHGYLLPDKNELVQ